VAVKLAVVEAAQRHGELIRNLEAERPRLCESNVMSLAGLTAAHRARLRRYEAEVVFAATAAWLRQGEVAGICDGHA